MFKGSLLTKNAKNDKFFQKLFKTFLLLFFCKQTPRRASKDLAALKSVFPGLKNLIAPKMLKRSLLTKMTENDYILTVYCA